MGSEAEQRHEERLYNRLISEKSPYLLQHARNPVDWRPWGTEAFEKALKENKPVFLSIGYSTCHWCHVMERESFADPEVAGLMNETFISIKVDREERPDIDNIYMTVCQMMTGAGGWPLTIIMTPDKRPFLSGTYFPRLSRFGRLGMLELIPRIRDMWNKEHEKILNIAGQVTSALQKESDASSTLGPDEALLKASYEELRQHFDDRSGGFGGAPKFPTPHRVSYLLRYWKRTGDAEALAMAEKTLEFMRNGGVYDQIGFGFHRYSTDPDWLVPHFEKMLYDQAMLSIAYTEAYQATRREEYKETAQEILNYVLRDMTAPEGGFCSAEDADSEGEEGKFYLWTFDEIRNILPEGERDLFIKAFSIERDGNYIEQLTGKKTGANILHLKKSLEELAEDLKTPGQAVEKQLKSAREKLFSARSRRIRPLKDDKILTDWNGLMLAAFAKAAGVFDEPQYAEASRHAADFILKNMRDADGRLLHRYRDGQAAVRANSTDYAFLIWGLLELYEASFDVPYLQTALDLNNTLLEHFWDGKAGGLYFTADDAEELLVRRKEIYDGAAPSGNSVAMLNLFRLGRMTSNPDLEEKAIRLGRAFLNEIKQSPSSYAQFMIAADFGIGPSSEVVIAGASQAKDTKDMLKALMTLFLPNKIVLFRPDELEMPDIVRLAGFTREQKGIDGKAAAYICLDYNCKYPTTEISEMLRLLNQEK